jgi:hypothetical protein
MSSLSRLTHHELAQIVRVMDAVKRMNNCAYDIVDTRLAMMENRKIMLWPNQKLAPKVEVHSAASAHDLAYQVVTAKVFDPDFNRYDTYSYSAVAKALLEMNQQ